MEKGKRIEHILRQISDLDEEQVLIKARKQELAKELYGLQNEEKCMEVLEDGKNI